MAVIFFFQQFNCQIARSQCGPFPGQATGAIGLQANGKRETYWNDVMTMEATKRMRPTDWTIDIAMDVVDIASLSD